MPHIMIVQSPYYKEVSKHLLNGACAALDKGEASYEVFEVSGALEIPLSIKIGIDSGKFDGYIALGCVIRGETSHYDIVCNESARGLSELALAHNAPIGNAILTCDTLAQAIVRADPGKKNKGADAMNAVFCLLDIKKKLQ